MLTSDSIAQGRILWLTNPFPPPDPQDSDDEPPEPPDLQELFHGIERGVFGHPVMILHTLEGTTDVAVCLLTTLHGRDLQDRKNTYEYQYNHHFYLAVYPTEPPCQFLYPQIRLVNNIQLRKAGYLCIRKRYTVPLSLLEPYERRRPYLQYQLTTESFAIVANTFAMKLSRPAEAAVTETTGPSHHSVPANNQDRLESKGATSQNGSELGSERPPLVKVESSAKQQSEPECDRKTILAPPDLANPSLTHAGSLWETAKNSLRLLLLPSELRTLVSAAFADDGKMAADKARKAIDISKIRSNRGKV